MARSEFGSRGSLGPFEEISHDMERVFDSLLGRTFGSMLRSNPGGDKFVPRLDLAENDSGFEIEIDLPGVEPENVKVEILDGNLIVSGQRTSKTEKSDKNYHRVERSSGSFYRSLTLPTEVDADRVDARYEQGVLLITLPKSAKQQAKRIQIRAGNSNKSHAEGQ